MQLVRRGILSQKWRDNPKLIGFESPPWNLVVGPLLLLFWSSLETISFQRFFCFFLSYCLNKWYKW